MTYKEARLLTIGTTVYDNASKNADGTSHRWRVNGMVKTWVRLPNRFYLPIKRGLYDYYKIDEGNFHLFSLTEEK